MYQGLPGDKHQELTTKHTRYIMTLTINTTFEEYAKHLLDCVFMYDINAEWRKLMNGINGTDEFCIAMSKELGLRIQRYFDEDCLEQTLENNLGISDDPVERELYERWMGNYDENVKILHDMLCDDEVKWREKFNETFPEMIEAVGEACYFWEDYSEYYENPED